MCVYICIYVCVHIHIYFFWGLLSSENSSSFPLCYHISASEAQSPNAHTGTPLICTLVSPLPPEAIMLTISTKSFFPLCTPEVCREGSLEPARSQTLFESLLSNWKDWSSGQQLSFSERLFLTLNWELESSTIIVQENL